MLLGLLLWHVAGEVGGDGLFHLARVRKLLDFDDLSLSAVGEFADGGLHPGYAFPLWHGFLALVAKVALVDPQDVVLHEPTVLAPLAVLVAYEAGIALFRAVGPACDRGCAQVALVAFAPGHGGAYTALALPGDRVAPAARAGGARAGDRVGRLAVACRAGVDGRRGARPRGRPSDLRPLPLAPVRRLPRSSAALWTRQEARRIGLALGALVAPGRALPALAAADRRATPPRTRPAAAELARGLRQYGGQLDVRSDDLYSLAPRGVRAQRAPSRSRRSCSCRSPRSRPGGAGPRTSSAARSRCSSICLVPWLFTPFSDAVSLSQSRRAAGFVPFAFAFAGGLVRRLGGWSDGWCCCRSPSRPGSLLQLAYPGDFDYRLTDGGPALATWIAAVGGAAALVVGLLRRHKPALEGGRGAGEWPENL